MANVTVRVPKMLVGLVVRVEAVVTGPRMAERKNDLAMEADTLAHGIISGIPVGDHRRIALNGYDSGGLRTHTGESGDLTVTAGDTLDVRIDMRPVTGAIGVTATVVEGVSDTSGGPGEVPECTAPQTACSDNWDVLEAPFAVDDWYRPSGWLGDGERGTACVEMTELQSPEPRAGDGNSTALRVEYKPACNGWAGVYWQWPEGNWGDEPGRQVRCATRVVFWARGESGGEVVEFLAGDIDNSAKPYRDSFKASLGRRTLAREWTRFEIPLVGKDLCRVIGAFAWSAPRARNPEGLVFWLDDVRYE
ncbi:MAG: hypothetical protein AB1505_23740 [Candidatus Latescibacterota bacterium]